MRYFIDCEFDGHNGPLLSIAVVPEEGGSIHIETLATDNARDPWVIENVVSRMDQHEAETMAIVTTNEVGRELRDFLRIDPAPVIVADSPVDIGRFCAAIMTSEQGEYEPNEWSLLTFEVHDVDCYPTTLPGAVQHNAWWDAMALREKLAASPKPTIVEASGMVDDDPACSICRGRTFASVDVRQFDGTFAPGPERRCVGCKTIFTAQTFASLSASSPSSEQGRG